MHEDSSCRQTSGARLATRAAPKSFVETLRDLRRIRFFMVRGYRKRGWEATLTPGGSIR
jgi:hypothetical protein